MRKPTKRESAPDRAFALLIVAVGLLLTPAVRLWSGPGSPWWLIFAVWAVLIALIRLAG